MCGIAGILALAGRKADSRSVRLMTDVIAHRGPDGEGHWVSSSGYIVLGHRRLSIIDLSDAGHQPMHYANGSLTITFNGEIYNYVELREQLIDKGYTFYSQTDTEVIMAAYHLWGIECLQHFDGMFAFALWDEKEQILFCARDRFGEKPFFYTLTDGTFFFGSEMKALWAAGVSKNLHPGSVYNYLSYSQLQNPNDPGQTFYADIRCLPAAHYMIVSPKDGIKLEKRYWDIDLGIKSELSEQEMIHSLQELFYVSLKRRLRSDVPLGSSLSGGLDSSLIVAAMDRLDQDQHITRKTFSAQFPGFKKDEARYQEIVVRNTHVESHSVFPTEESLLNNWEALCYFQEEPFSSASINVQYEVYGRAKKEGVTVMLDGQGADELLAGYHSYYNSYFRELSCTNKPLYRTAYEEYRKLHAGNQINPVQMPSKWRHLKAVLPESLVNRLVQQRMQINQARKALAPAYYSEYKKYDFQFAPSFNSLNEDLYYSTCIIGLQELLRYADRNAMAHSVEVRLPFLSHELVAFIFSLPAHMKIRNGYTKWVLRMAFDDLLPPEIIWRKDKIGFEPPQQNWLDANIMQERIINSENKLRQAGIINNNPLMDSGSRWRRLVVGQLL